MNQQHETLSGQHAQHEARSRGRSADVSLNATWPKISIVTPSFNQARFLEATIRSVLEQRYPNLEYIVVDGGSTDGSADIIQQYASHLAYWVSEPDDGQSAAIKKGFENATGEILAWLNSDDLYLPGTLSRVAQAFKRDPKIHLIYGDVYIIDEVGRQIGERRLTRTDRYDFLGQGNCLAQPATFWTRRVYDQVGGIDPAYYFQMDLDFFIRVASVARMRYLKGYLAKIRIHPEGKMVKAEQIRRTELLQLQQRYIAGHGPARMLYTRPFLLSRQFVHYLLQGDTHYAVQKVWRRILDGKLFRESRVS